MHQDVPSPIDLRLMSDASEWERTATEKRPWRAEFFEKFADELKELQPPIRRVLELGSGPGFLASHLLGALPDLHMVLLDFSSALHELARRRLGPMVSRVDFLEKTSRTRIGPMAYSPLTPLSQTRRSMNYATSAMRFNCIGRCEPS
jgi:methylase of polypeptide subunit release factors